MTSSGDALAVVVARAAPMIVVSNEVGLGIVPDNSSARSYRDVLGQVNQAWVAAADRAGLLVAGRVVPLPDPTANADWFDG